MDVFGAVSKASFDLLRQKHQGAQVRTTYVSYDDGVLCWYQEGDGYNQRNVMVTGKTSKEAGMIARHVLDSSWIT